MSKISSKAWQYKEKLDRQEIILKEVYIMLLDVVNGDVDTIEIQDMRDIMDKIDIEVQENEI
jgi:hypothetical protein